MLMNIDKKDLISLVKGTIPDYSIMNHPLISISGKFTEEEIFEDHAHTLVASAMS